MSRSRRESIGDDGEKPQKKATRRDSILAEMELGEEEISRRYRAATMIQRMVRERKGFRFTSIVHMAVHNEHIRQLSRLNESDVTDRAVLLELWTKYLHDLDFFQKHPMQTCLDMLAVSKFRHLPINELLFKKGDVAEEAYIIWEGEISIFIGQKADKPLEVVVEHPKPTKELDDKKERQDRKNRRGEAAFGTKGDGGGAEEGQSEVKKVPPPPSNPISAIPLMINNAVFRTRGRRLRNPEPQPAPIPEALIIAHGDAPVCHLEKGKMFGEFAMLSTNKTNARSAAAVATKETFLLSIPKKAFERLAMQQEQDLFDMKLLTIRNSMFSYIAKSEAAELRLARCLYPKKYRTGDVLLAQNHNGRSLQVQQFTLLARGTANRVNNDGTKAEVGPGVIISPTERLVVTTLTPVLAFTLPVSDIHLLNLKPQELKMLEMLRRNPRAFENMVVETHLKKEVATIKEREQRDRLREQGWRRKRKNHNKMMVLKWKGIVKPAPNTDAGRSAAARKNMTVKSNTTGIRSSTTSPKPSIVERAEEVQVCDEVVESVPENKLRTGFGSELGGKARVHKTHPGKYRRNVGMLKENLPTSIDEEEQEAKAGKRASMDDMQFFIGEVDAAEVAEREDGDKPCLDRKYSDDSSTDSCSSGSSDGDEASSHSKKDQYLLVQQQLEDLGMEGDEMKERAQAVCSPPLMTTSLPHLVLQPQYYERQLWPLAGLTAGLKLPQARGQRSRPGSAASSRLASSRSRPNSASTRSRPASATSSRQGSDRLGISSPVAGRSFYQSYASYPDAAPTYGLSSIRSPVGLPAMAKPLDTQTILSTGSHRTGYSSPISARSRPGSASYPRSQPGRTRGY